MKPSILTFIQPGSLTQLAAPFASIYTTTRNFVSRQRFASMLSGITLLRNSRSDMINWILSVFMKVRLTVVCGVEIIYVMVFYVEYMMNVSLVAVAPSCLSHMIVVCQYLATTVQDETTLELNTHTEIITSIDKMSFYQEEYLNNLRNQSNQKRKSSMKSHFNEKLTLRKTWWKSWTSERWIRLLGKVKTGEIFQTWLKCYHLPKKIISPKRREEDNSITNHVNKTGQKTYATAFNVRLMVPVEVAVALRFWLKATSVVHQC